MKGFKEALWLAVLFAGAYLLLNAILLAVSFYEVGTDSEVWVNWKNALLAEHSNPWVILGIALILFPKLVLGLSGFETGVAVMTHVKGAPGDTTRHPAGRIGAVWYAVYVETPREEPTRINREDAGQLAENIQMAEDLGATMVKVKVRKAADGLIEFAKREGITHVIFGQSARNRWHILLQGSVLNRFLAEVKGAAVQIIPPSEKPEKPE